MSLLGDISINILLYMQKVTYVWSDSWPVPPVGIAYVSSSLKATGFNAYTLNFNIGK